MHSIEVFAKVIYYLWKAQKSSGSLHFAYRMHARLLVEESTSWKVH